MKNLAPNIYRQRLLIEGFYDIEVNKQTVEEYLLGLPKHLDLRTYGQPIVFSPSSGMSKEENQGYDGFIPLIDSGISIYIWSTSKFFSSVLYTCKGFKNEKAIQFTKEFFDVNAEIAYLEF